MSKKLSLVVLDRFKKLYAQVPSFECKGLCQNSCTLIPLTRFEWERLVRRGIPEVSYVRDGIAHCPLLGEDGKCQAYDIRPMICRLWGAVDAEGMRCPHGCRPATYLMEGEGHKLLARADQIGGGPTPELMAIVYQSTEILQKTEAEK